MNDISTKYFILGIVGIVAVVGISFIAFIGYSASNDNVGWAAKVANVFSRTYCSDSDNGYLYTVQGTTILTKNRKDYIYTDSCISGDMVMEYACSGVSVVEATAPCTYGCTSGACLKYATAIVLE